MSPRKSPFCSYFLLLVSMFFSMSSYAFAAPPSFGLWVEAENHEVRPWRSRKEFDDFISFIDKAKFTDLYCQVYRGGRSWFPSVMADDSPYREDLAIGLDPLKEILAWAKKRGVRVHAWMNMLRITGERQTPVLQVLGDNVLLVDNYGNSIIDYASDGNAPGVNKVRFKLGTPGVWLDPSFEPLRHYLVETIRDLLAAYPELDGVHLDMIRYPEVMIVSSGARANDRPEFGYSEESIERFFALAGMQINQDISGIRSRLISNVAWKSWKRSQVSLLVSEIKQLMLDINPSLELSAAVVGSHQRAYSDMYQDWNEWIKNGIVDSVIPMSYSTDHSRVYKETKQAVSFVRNKESRVLVGLGAWLMSKSPEKLNKQGRIALASGADGVVLFSYSNLARQRGQKLVESFQKDVFR